MMTEIENTLYILESLSTTDSEDYLESVEIEVYYGDDQGNEGMSTTYDMPTIADKAIEAIDELRKANAELVARIAKAELAFSVVEGRNAEFQKIIDSQVFPSIGNGFSGDYINGYEKALNDLDEALKARN